MIKAAIVGLGWWGQTILKNLAASSVIKPVLGVDPLDSARAAATELGIETAPRFEDALAHADVEAVIICTPQDRHAGQIAAAARSGRCGRGCGCRWCGRQAGLSGGRRRR